MESDLETVKEYDMGLRIHALELIETLKPFLPDNPVCYVIGTQDCNFTYRMLMKRYPKKAKEIKEKVKDVRKPCDLKTVFNTLGFKSVVTIDINDRADIRLDLSSPIPEEYYEKANLVCNFGTLEHIFDLKTAVVNMNLFAKKGGILFHMSPVSMYRHGFVNFNPSFYDSLYAQSGYKQIFRTMNVSIYNPFYIININDVPKNARMFFKLTNKILRPVSLLYRYNLPLSREGDNNLLSFFNFWITHFGLPKNLLYCCAYQKLSDHLKIPYDIWE